MRILHVLAERGFSGGEHQLLAVLGHLKSRGHESVLALNKGAAFHEHGLNLGLQVYEIPMRNDVDLAAMLKLRSLFRSSSPDLVHLACSRSHKLGGLAGAAGRSRPPIVVTRRMDYPLGGSLYRRWLYRKAIDGVVVISEGVMEEVRKLGVDPDRVHLIHDGVDTNAIERATDAAARAGGRCELELEDRDVLGLTLASLHRRKGLDVLVNALRRLGAPASGRLVWVIAGEGPMRRGLLEQAVTLPDGVELKIQDKVEPPTRLLAAADLFCLPSRNEGLGVALLEAMAAGLPVVASKVGGMREVVVSEESGFLVPVEDGAALAKALARLLEDRELGRMFGRRARERVRTSFDLQRMCEQTEAVYARLAR
ncbi:MAG: glycosyltransferase [Planctomycetota bacterium]